MRLEFDTGWVSDRGGREANEDFHGYSSVGGLHCWVIADGLGGHEDGATASQLVVSTVLDAFRARPAIAANAVKAYIQAAHAAIQAHQTHKQDKAQMGATLVVLISDGAMAVWGHVGDSRLFHVRGGRIMAETRDHSLHQMKAGAAAQSGTGTQGSGDRSSLLQAVGLSGQILPTVTKSPQRLMPGDAFVLCVDGFWEKVFEPEIEADFAGSRDTSGWLRLMRRRVRERLREGDDNYTAVAVRARGPVVAIPPEAVTGRPNWLPGPRDAGIMTALGVLAVILLLMIHLAPPPVTPPPGPSGPSGPVSPSGPVRPSGAVGASGASGGSGPVHRSADTAKATTASASKASQAANKKAAKAAKPTHGKPPDKNTPKAVGHTGAVTGTGSKASTAAKAPAGVSGAQPHSGSKASSGAQAPAGTSGARPHSGSKGSSGAASPPHAVARPPAPGKWNNSVVFQPRSTFKMSSDA
jgi:serine/threonine protein phosphatase PrpC